MLRTLLLPPGVLGVSGKDPSEIGFRGDKQDDPGKHGTVIDNAMQPSAWGTALADRAFFLAISAWATPSPLRVLSLQVGYELIRTNPG